MISPLFVQLTHLERSFYPIYHTFQVCHHTVEVGFLVCMNTDHKNNTPAIKLFSTGKSTSGHSRRFGNVTGLTGSMNDEKQLN